MTARKCNDDLLKMLYPIQSIPLEEVAKRVGYSNQGSVTRRAVKLGLTMRTDQGVAANRNEQIRAAIAKGIHQKEVASLHGLSVQRVRAIAFGEGASAETESDRPRVKMRASIADIEAALAKHKAAKLQARGVSA
jgi:hypothetical protein